MTYRNSVAIVLLLLSMQASAGLRGVDQTLPVKGGRPAVAAVNGEWISLDEFVAQLEPSADRAHLRQGQGNKQDFELLDRLINVKLVVQEAATMGLDDLPEITKQVEVTSRAVLREVLMDGLVKYVRPDPAAVEKQYKDLVREWQTVSLLFQDEASARRARDEIAKGAKFADVAARMVANKSARTDGDNAYHGRKDYLPQIADAIAKLPVGQVSPVIRIQAGFVVLTVTGIRYPDDPKARAEARQKVLSQQQQAVLEAHEQALRRKHVVINQAVLDGLDFAAAKPGIDALVKDQRVVATIKGGAPVTVADLTDYLRMQMFHGSDQAGQGKRMNSRKQAALDATLGRRLLNMEAQSLGIDKTSAYRDKVKAYKESLVFDTFVQKVIAPDNKMREEEVRQHYDEHLKEYSYPEMRRIRSLAFTARSAAEDAIKKLRGGADFGWVAANAENQVDKTAEGLLTFDGQPIMADSMPEGVQKTLAGSKAGDFRLYASPAGHFYVLAIQQVVASNARPYQEVRDEIARKLYAEKIKKSMEAYLGKLRAVSKIEIYLKKLA